MPFRWSVAATLALLTFVACWGGLKFGGGLDSGQALGWSVVPFSLALALGGAWADKARAKHGRPAQEANSPIHHNKRIRTVQKQHAKGNSQQLQAGRDIKIGRE